MTRETKIGLLVGLAFIIVIGVLLSDHLTSATNPQMSTKMAGIGTQVGDSLAAPGGYNPNKNITIIPPGNVLPPEQVPTRYETARRPVEAAPAIVDIGSPTGPERKPIEIVNIDPRTNTTTLPPVRFVEPAPVVTPLPVVPTRVSAVTDVTAPKREHKAQSGDTVSKMAYKYYGKNTKELRDLITKANPSLQRSPDRIVVGQMYVIPPAPSAGQNTVAASTVGEAMMTSATTQPAASATAAATSVKIYTVKANDSLWRIATEQCHDINAAKQILALNKDVLKGSNKLQVGMKLKLPEKKVS